MKHARHPPTVLDTVTLIRIVSVLLLAALMTACSSSTEEAETSADDSPSRLVEEAVTYAGGGVSMEGYLVYDSSMEGRRPGVLVVHEWWGHNEHARNRARMLAEAGYTALAVDMYGGGRTAAHPQGASELVREVASSMESATARFNAARELLRNHVTTDPDDIAAIGFCFGGGVVLEMARGGMDLDGVVSFHGSVGAPENPTQPGTVEAKILVIVGEDDPFVPKELLEELKADLKQANADYEVIVYEGVRHSFTNPGADAMGAKFDLPLLYDAKADSSSWSSMLSFFDQIFVD